MAATPLQDSLLNSPFTLKSGDAYHRFQLNQEIVLALEQTSFVPPFQDLNSLPPISAVTNSSVLHKSILWRFISRSALHAGA